MLRKTEGKAEAEGAPGGARETEAGTFNKEKKTMNDETNNEAAAEAVETAEAIPTVEAAETAEVHEPLLIRKDREGREWAEVWRDGKIMRIRTDLISAMSLEREAGTSDDGEVEVTDSVPYVHLAGGKDVLRVNETSWTALNDYLFPPQS